MRRLLCFIFLLTFVYSSPALAHSLRVFATLERDNVSGYGFFVGGGRPKAAEWTAAMGGQDIAEGHTDAEGAFSFAIPGQVDGPVTVTVNSGEGHIATRVLGIERFAARPEQAPIVETPAASATPPTEAMVQVAVAREIAPLMERIEHMDARMRVTDVISGLCLIFGIAGIALWARGRRA